MQYGQYGRNGSRWQLGSQSYSAYKAGISMGPPGLLPVALAAMLLLGMSGAALSQSEGFTGEDAVDEAVIKALRPVLTSSTALGFSPDPLTAFAADNVAFATNLALKYIKAPLKAPPDRSFQPRDSLRDPETGRTEANCVHRFTLPQSVYSKEDIFGINIGNVLLGKGPGLGIPQDWGDLGVPEVFHYNTHVLLSAAGAGIQQSDLPQTVTLPAGNHTIRWRADTLYDLLFDAVLPAALVAASGYGKYKRGEFLLAQPAAVEKLAKTYRANQLVGKNIIQKLGIKISDACQTRPEKCVKAAYKLGVGPTADFFTDFEILSVRRDREQTITVYDLHDPTLVVNTPELVLEAADIGGTFKERVNGQLMASVQADDACGRPVGLSNDLPTLLPVGPTDVTWTATDLGPNLQGGRNSVQAFQRVIVQDTQAPIIVPPPGRVIEVDPTDSDRSDGLSAAGVNPAVVDLGLPRVVDLADPAPTISTDAPEFFPVNSRTEVQWSATDNGFPTPNTSTASQLITVKLAGSNTAPSVRNVSATTLTSQVIDIRLNGLDNDLLDGRVDPLAMTIVDRPQNGEFVAPLLPYFIEDYRTNPAGPYGEAFFLAGNKPNWLYDNVCRVGSGPTSERIRRDWVYRPRFVQVTDDGTYYMIDQYWRCQASGASANERISKWDRDGNYLGQIDYDGTTDAFVMDQDNLIYTLTKQGAGSSTTLTLRQYRPSFDTDSDYRRDLWKFTFNDTGDDPVSNNQYSYARVDSRRGIVYVNDRRRIFAFDVRADLADPQGNSSNGMGDYYIGALKGGEQVFACTSFGSSWSGFAMEVDSQGNLYVADTCGDRIHKFMASGFDNAGNAQLGEYVGWMGRCESSTNKACDEATGTSKGYSCTDETCTVDQSEGPEPGQFSTPVYLAIDPNDILYVADSSNRRIQRFAPDGSFAGQAQSSGTGINRGENPSFVLGNIGNPKAVTVNSTQFFVVDRDESFINVFETSPLKDISDDGATVTYVSNFDFHSGADRFTYRASDGLDDSNLGTVSIQVNRNFRPPVVEPLELSTAEDSSIGVGLLGDDPDGILGEDFNGLDTLTFEVLEQPANGTLSGTPPALTYTPSADFFGTDSFTYRASDGRLDSEPATVNIEVSAVDDPVRLNEATWQERVGRGFPTLFMASYTDDGGSPYTLFMNWGDGTIESEGDLVDPDGEGGQDPRLEGVKLVAPTARNGEGMAVADHVYQAVGTQSSRFCIADALENACVDRTVAVLELANLAVSLGPESVETSAATQEMQFTLTNGQPEGWAGLTAQQLVLAVSEPQGYRVVGFSGASAPAGCRLIGGGLRCQPPALPPGGSFSINLEVEPATPAIYSEQLAPVIVEVTTSTPALDSDYVATQPVRFLVNRTDSDGDGMSDRFETVYGLAPRLAGDAANDNDGDGLTNLEEYVAKTDPTDRDSDGDGVRDGLDPAPLDPAQTTNDADLNSDGQIDAGDVVLLQRSLSGAGDELLLDLNDDGLTDAADLLLLQQQLGE